MARKYSFEGGGKIARIYMRNFGLNQAGILNSMREFRQDPQFTANCGLLVDYRGCSRVASARELIGYIGVLKAYFAGQKIALVSAPENQTFSINYLSATFSAEVCGPKLRAIATEEDALAWLTANELSGIS